MLRSLKEITCQLFHGHQGGMREISKTYRLKFVDPVHLFLSLSSETEFRQKPPPIAVSAVACININL